MRVPAVVHVGTPDHSLDLCVPHAPAPLVRNNDIVDQAYDLLEHKALDYGGDQGRRQVEEMELRWNYNTCGSHGEFSVRVAVEEQTTLDTAEDSCRWARLN